MLTYVAIFLIGAVSGAVGGAYALWKMADTALKNQDKQTLRVTAYYEVANQWVRNLHEGHRLSAQMVEKGYKRIAIYGYAELGKRLLEELHQDGEVEIAYIIDQNAGRVASSLPVYKPSDNLPPVDAIVVTPVHVYVQIAKMMRGLVPYDIVSLEDVVYDT